MRAPDNAQAYGGRSRHPNHGKLTAVISTLISPGNRRSPRTTKSASGRRVISLQFPSFPFISLQFPFFPFIFLHFPSPCVLFLISLHFTSLHVRSFPCTSLHFPSVPFIAFSSWVQSSFPPTSLSSCPIISRYLPSLHFTSLPFHSFPVLAFHFNRLIHHLQDDACNVLRIRVGK